VLELGFREIAPIIVLNANQNAVAYNLFNAHISNFCTAKMKRRFGT
jgi:hypothetical protein